MQPYISDGDRDTTLRRVQEAFATGHLSPAEMDTRLERALTATTRGELVSVLDDLPGPFTDRPVRIESTGGRIKRRGNWRVPRVLSVGSVYGGVHLDLSRADIPHATIEIDLSLMYGSARIVLPAGATVDYDGVATPWRNTAYRAPKAAGAGRVHVRITGRLSYGRLRIRHRRTR
ncbi:DUF1707 SHOCT-like domain-containing protein [Nonomuraea sp. NPDC002799]